MRNTTGVLGLIHRIQCIGERKRRKLRWAAISSLKSKKSFLDAPRTSSECQVRLQHERNNYTLSHKPSDQQMKRKLWESRKKKKSL